MFKGGSSRDIKSDNIRIHESFLKWSQNHQNLDYDPYKKYDHILHFLLRILPFSS